MAKNDKDLKRVTKQLAIKAAAAGYENYVDLVDDLFYINIEILNNLSLEATNTLERKESIRLLAFIKDTLTGYQSGCISKRLVNKSFSLY